MSSGNQNPYVFRSRSMMPSNPSAADIRPTPNDSSVSSTSSAGAPSGNQNSNPHAFRSRSIMPSQPSAPRLSTSNPPPSLHQQEHISHPGSHNQIPARPIPTTGSAGIPSRDQNPHVFRSRSMMPSQPSAPRPSVLNPPPAVINQAPSPQVGSSIPCRPTPSVPSAGVTPQDQNPHAFRARSMMPSQPLPTAPRPSTSNPSPAVITQQQAPQPLPTPPTSSAAGNQEFHAFRSRSMIPNNYVAPETPEEPTDPISSGSSSSSSSSRSSSPCSDELEDAMLDRIANSFVANLLTASCRVLSTPSNGASATAGMPLQNQNPHDFRARSMMPSQSLPSAPSPSTSTSSAPLPVPPTSSLGVSSGVPPGNQNPHVFRSRSMMPSQPVPSAPKPSTSNLPPAVRNQGSSIPSRPIPTMSSAGVISQDQNPHAFRSRSMIPSQPQAPQPLPTPSTSSAAASSGNQNPHVFRSRSMIPNNYVPPETPEEPTSQISSGSSNSSSSFRSSSSCSDEVEDAIPSRPTPSVPSAGVPQDQNPHAFRSRSMMPSQPLQSDPRPPTLASSSSSPATRKRELPIQTANATSVPSSVSSGPSTGPSTGVASQNQNPHAFRSRSMLPSHLLPSAPHPSTSTSSTAVIIQQQAPQPLPTPPTSSVAGNQEFHAFRSRSMIPNNYVPPETPEEPTDPISSGSSNSSSSSRSSSPCSDEIEDAIPSRPIASVLSAAMPPQDQNAHAFRSRSMMPSHLLPAAPRPPTLSSPNSSPSKTKREPIPQTANATSAPSSVPSMPSTGPSTGILSQNQNPHAFRSRSMIPNNYVPHAPEEPTDPISSGSSSSSSSSRSSSPCSDELEDAIPSRPIASVLSAAVPPQDQNPHAFRSRSMLPSQPLPSAPGSSTSIPPAAIGSSGPSVPSNPQSIPSMSSAGMPENPHAFRARSMIPNQSLPSALRPATSTPATSVSAAANQVQSTDDDESDDDLTLKPVRTLINEELKRLVERIRKRVTDMVQQCTRKAMQWGPNMWEYKKERIRELIHQTVTAEMTFQNSVATCRNLERFEKMEAAEAASKDKKDEKKVEEVEKDDGVVEPVDPIVERAGLMFKRLRESLRKTVEKYDALRAGTTPSAPLKPSASHKTSESTDTD